MNQTYNCGFLNSDTRNRNKKHYGPYSKDAGSWSLDTGFIKVVIFILSSIKNRRRVLPFSAATALCPLETPGRSSCRKKKSPQSLKYLT
jgi:hypothetical protein